MWIPSTKKLFGLPACKHKVTNELVSASKFGEIYAYNDTTMGIIVYSTKVANKVRKVLNMGTFDAIDKHDEDLIFASVDKVKDVSKALGIKNNRVSMAKRLNE
jgi:hypothetical protein